MTKLPTGKTMKNKFIKTWLEDFGNPCIFCGITDQHFYRIVENDHEDEQHKCLECGKTWFVDKTGSINEM